MKTKTKRVEAAEYRVIYCAQDRRAKSILSWFTIEEAKSMVESMDSTSLPASVVRITTITETVFERKK